MAGPDRRAWYQAAAGGALVALGSLLVGAGRAAKPVAREAPAEPAGSGRSRPQRSNVTTKPRSPEVPPRTQYWPPPAPPPLEGTPEDQSAEASDRVDHLPVDAESEKLGYEVKDTRASYLARIMVFSVAVIAGSVAGLFYMIGHYHRVDTPSGPLTPQQSAVIVPPGPHLQAHPLNDIAVQKQRESDLLLFYAWTDPSHRVARIPIARAQALVIGRPLDPLPGEGAPPGPTPATGSPGPGSPAPARPQP